MDLSHAEMLGCKPDAWGFNREANLGAHVRHASPSHYYATGNAGHSREELIRLVWTGAISAAPSSGRAQQLDAQLPLGEL